MHENREIPQCCAKQRKGRGKPVADKPDLNACGKSDPAVVPVKAPNEAAVAAEEGLEERAGK
jgi:hypothetical protein